jgi:two-component system response regulator AlgR
MLKILIVDDEPLARNRLSSLIGELPGAHRLTEAEHGLAALEIITQDPPDIVLLDIRMPVMDGLEVAHHLTGMERPPAVIFTTAYQDHALEAFDTQAVDYLLKPIRKERLRQALARAHILQRARVDELRRIEQPRLPRTHLSATMHGKLKLVPVKDIRYLKAEQKYVSAGWPGGILLLDESLVALEDEFRQSFIRIHRNALIAMEYVETLTRDKDGELTVTLRDVKVTLQVSRRNAAEVRKALKNL